MTNLRLLSEAEIMNNIFKVLCLFILLVWMISSCTHDKSDDPQPNVTVCDSATVKYSVDIEPIISAKCAVSGCHGTGFSSGGVTLDTYEKVKAKADAGRLKARAIDNIPSQMPPAPNPTLSASEKTKIQNWIDEGACP